MNPELVFEVSWEICNKVGGIYTVVRSKAESVVERFADSYFLIGPYFQHKASGEFEEKVPPENLKGIFNQLRQEGITCHYGKWLIAGEPAVILIDYSEFAKNKDGIKAGLWNTFKIDSLNTQYHDFDEPLIWAYSAGKLIEKLALQENKKCIAQFHEWLSGAGLLYLKSVNAPVATIFTTHATMLGRTLAGSGINLYAELNNIDSMSMAYKYQVHAKHQTEIASAKSADIFTTVSEITGIEAEALLGRKPDVLLPNGLDMRNFPSFEEAAIKHSLFKRKMKEFSMAYFFPYYSFELDNTLFYFIAARYEFRAKGIDCFISALGRLNQKLKQEKNSKNIVAFFFIPGNVRGIKPEVVECKTIFDDIRETIIDDEKEIVNRLVFSSLIQKTCNEEYILGKVMLTELHKKILKFKKQGLPPLSTHDLYDEHTDPIINSFRANGLENKKEDKVKVIFYPIYLTGADKLLDLNYYEAMQASHFGVFPSLYEPWGYTPLEAGALLTSSLTTDLSGFGRYIAPDVQKKKFPGIYVINSLGRTSEDVVQDLTQILFEYSKFTTDERVKNKIEAKKISQLADWKNMIKHYFSAYQAALEKKWS